MFTEIISLPISQYLMNIMQEKHVPAAATIWTCCYHAQLEQDRMGHQVTSSLRAARCSIKHHKTSRGQTQAGTEQQTIPQSGTESPAVNIPRMLLNPCYGFRSQNNVKLLSPTSVSDHQYQDQVSGLTLPAMVSSYGSSSSYNEYCVPRAVFRGDTTTDLSRLRNQSSGVGREVCESQEILEQWEMGRMATQQQTLLSDFVILI